MKLNLQMITIASSTVLFFASCSDQTEAKKVEFQGVEIERAADGHESHLRTSAITSGSNWVLEDPQDVVMKVRSKLSLDVLKKSKHYRLAFNADDTAKPIKAKLKVFAAKSTTNLTDEQLIDTFGKFNMSTLEARRMLGDWYIAALELKGVGYVANLWYPVSQHKMLSDPSFFFTDYDQPLPEPNIQVQPAGLQNGQLRWVYTSMGNQPLWFGVDSHERVAFAPLQQKTYRVVTGTAARTNAHNSALAALPLVLEQEAIRLIEK
jgi:hypothetical protein